jgi:hypothetical protein
VDDNFFIGRLRLFTLGLSIFIGKPFFMTTTGNTGSNIVGYVIGAAALGGVVFLLAWALHKGWMKGG